jgi:hypothetical protein
VKTNNVHGGWIRFRRPPPNNGNNNDNGYYYYYRKIDIVVAELEGFAWLM